MSHALLETLENLRNLSHGPFETLERLGSLGNLSHGPLANLWYFSHGPFETFFLRRPKFLCARQSWMRKIAERRERRPR